MCARPWPACRWTSCAGHRTLAAAGILGEDGSCFAHALIGTAIAEDLACSEFERLHLAAARAQADRGASDDVVASHLLQAAKHADPEVSALLTRAASDAWERGARTRLPRTSSEPSGEGAAVTTTGACSPTCDVRLRRGPARREDAPARGARHGARPREPGLGAHPARRAQHRRHRRRRAARAAGARARERDRRRHEARARDRRARHRCLCTRTVSPSGSSGSPPPRPPRRRPAPDTRRARAPRVARDRSRRAGGRRMRDAGGRVARGRPAARRGAAARGGPPRGPRARAHRPPRRRAAGDRCPARGRVARGSLRMRAGAAWYQADLALRNGRIAEAETEARFVLDLVDEDVNMFTAGAVEILVRALSARGEFAEAHGCCASAASTARSGPGSGRSGSSTRAAPGARRRRLRARPRRGAAGRRAARRPRRRNATWAVWRPTAAVALAHLGRSDEAIALADAELAIAARFGARAPIVTALHARVVAEPDPELRLALCERALTVAGPGSTLLDTARVRVELGTTLRAWAGGRGAHRPPAGARRRRPGGRDARRRARAA